MKNIFFFIISISFLLSCSQETTKEKGIVLTQTTVRDGISNFLEEDENTRPFTSRPSDVLLTAHPNYRMVTIYKVNYHEGGYSSRSRRPKSFIGTNRFHRNYFNYYDENNKEARRYTHFMPGIEAVYGYNMVNVGHYDMATKKRQNLFEHPVLINTVYYPALLQDSLNNQPITRDYYMVSAYDEDTNQDSIINHKDLRRLYHFNLQGEAKTPLVPLNYSVLSSEYDAENDYMYVFARWDENNNGRREEEEPVQVFWLDLKSPRLGERLY